MQGDFFYLFFEDKYATLTGFRFLRLLGLPGRRIDSFPRLIGWRRSLLRGRLLRLALGSQIHKSECQQEKQDEVMFIPKAHSIPS